MKDFLGLPLAEEKWRQQTENSYSIFAEKQTKCTQQRQSAYNEGSIQQDGTTLLRPGLFLPTCSKDGSFKEIQCHPSTGYCWCVDKEGNKRDETAVFAQTPTCKQRKLIMEYIVYNNINH